MNEHKGLKISELSQAAGLPASTIRYYIQEGLLPAPVKRGKTRAYYSKVHLEAITLIKKKQLKEKKPLQVIKEEMGHELSQSKDFDGENIPSSRHEEIISSAIELFLRKGYAETSIADIAKRTRMSKETFYSHFKNKEGLFMECADRIFHAMYDNVYQEIRDEKDRLKRLEKRRRAFFASYPKWIEFMNLVKSLSVGENLAFKEKFRRLLQQIIHPLIREIEYLKKEGRVRKEIDSAAAGYFLMGMAEYSASLINQGAYSPEEIDEFAFSIMENGLLK